MFQKLFKKDNVSYYRKLADLDLQNFQTFKLDYIKVKKYMDEVSDSVNKIIDIDEAKLII